MRPRQKAPPPEGEVFIHTTLGSLRSPFPHEDHLPLAPSTPRSEPHRRRPAQRVSLRIRRASGPAIPCQGFRRPSHDASAFDEIREHTARPRIPVDFTSGGDLLAKIVAFSEMIRAACAVGVTLRSVGSPSDSLFSFGWLELALYANRLLAGIALWVTPLRVDRTPRAAPSGIPAVRRTPCVVRSRPIEVETTIELGPRTEEPHHSPSAKRRSVVAPRRLPPPLRHGHCPLRRRLG
jgi:hypothetical protein